MHKKTAGVIHKILHFFEGAIAIMTLIVLVGMLAMEVYRMFTVSTYFDSINTYLHNILTLVVGLEFVRMLLDMTPANTLEVLIVAIALNMLGLPKERLRVGNMLPAMFLPIAYIPLANWLSRIFANLI